MIITSIKINFVVFAVLVSVCLLSCKPKGAEKSNMYLCSSSGNLYSFNLKTGKLNWTVPGNTNNDELSFLSFKGENLIKAYVDSRISAINKNTGKINWTYHDTVSPNQAFYHYDFSSVRFGMFSQYPLIYKNAMIFANTHGELKSIDLTTKKLNWTYQVNIPHNFAPILLKDKLLLNMGYRIVTVDPNNGQLIRSADFETPIPMETVVDDTYDYAADVNGNAYCLDSDLNIIWNYKNKGELSVKQNVAVGDKEIVYGGKSLICLDKASGKLKWQTKLAEDEPLLYNAINGDEVYANTPHDIIVLDKDNGKIIRRKHITGREIIGMARYDNGFYYYVCSDKSLYKIDASLIKETAVFKQIAYAARVEDVYIAFN